MKGPAVLSANIFFPMVFFWFLIVFRTLHKRKKEKERKRREEKKKKKKRKGNRTSIKLHLLAHWKPMEL